MRRQSKIKNEQTTWQELLIYYAIGFVITLYVAILCGSAWMPYQGISEYIDSFVRFIIFEHHILVGFTAATPKFIAVFEAIWTLGYLYFQTKIKHPYRGREHGDAHWGDARTFTKDFANHDVSHEWKVNFGDMEGEFTVNTHNYWLAENVYVNIDNDLTANLNILIVGPPGSGKSFRVARPVLSQLAGCYLVTDPKGELSKQSGQYFEDNEYNVFVLNVESEEGMANSIHFNPFKYLRNESDIMSLAQILFKSTSDPEASSNDAFFEQSAEVLLTDIFYLMHYTYDEDKKDWKHFVELLESTVVKADPRTRGIDNSDEKGIYQRFKAANENWHKGVYTDKVPQKEHLKGWVDIEKFYTGAQETTSSIVASLDAHCRYMKLKCVQDLLSEDDIKIEQNFGYCRKSPKDAIGSQKSILYIVTSEDKRYYDWITSMVYSMFFEELYHLTGNDEQLHESLPHHLTFLMDEFNNVTLPDSFVDKLSTMRSRNMSAIVIVQNLQQLKNKYPKNDMDKAFIGYMSFIDVLGAPDWDSCEYLSKMFGTMTIHKQTTGLSHGGQGSFSENEDVMQKPLFSAEEMYGMDKSGPCAMIIKGTDPLYVNKVQFQNSPLLPLLTRKTPYVNKKNKSRKLTVNSDAPIDEQVKIYFGEVAEKKIKEIEKQGIQVVSIKEDDLDAWNLLEEQNVFIKEKTDNLEELISYARNNEAQLRKKKLEEALDWDLYQDSQILCVQRLKNSDYSIAQIKALTPLILLDADYAEITTYFNKKMPLAEMEAFVKKYSNIKKRGMNK